MDAVIIAGGKPDKKSKIWTENNELPRPLVEINGKPMVQWIIDAVNKSKAIEKIYIVGLDDISKLTFEKPVTQLPDHGGIFKNLAAAAQMITDTNPEVEYFLGISADIPLVDSKIIDDIAEKEYETGFDIFYNVIEKKTMDQKFKGAERTYIRFKDGKFCGGDMHVINARTCVSPVIQSFEKYRKNPIKLITTVGFDLLFRMLISPPSIDDAAKIVYARTGIMGKVINCRIPEIGMDIDNQEQLTLVRELLSKKTIQR